MYPKFFPKRSWPSAETPFIAASSLSRLSLYLRSFTLSLWLLPFVLYKQEDGFWGANFCIPFNSL